MLGMRHSLLPRPVLPVAATLFEKQTGGSRQVDLLLIFIRSCKSNSTQTGIRPASKQHLDQATSLPVDGVPEGLEKKTWIPIVHSTFMDVTYAASRTEYPLRLAYAMPIHKSQGESLEMIWVDFGIAFSTLIQQAKLRLRRGLHSSHFLDAQIIKTFALMNRFLSIGYRSCTRLLLNWQEGWNKKRWIAMLLLQRRGGRRLMTMSIVRGYRS
jgi:hypothetical protein